MYFALRAALGPALESLILLDRLMFLAEASSPGAPQAAGPLRLHLAPLFEAARSPRNFVLAAWKPA